MKPSFRFVLGLSLIISSITTVYAGPFTTVPTTATPFNFSLEDKLEVPTLIDFPGTVSGATTATRAEIDPVTGKAKLDQSGNPVLDTLSIPNGTVLTGAEGYTLPIDATIMKAAVSDATLNVGSYVYLGDVPRFDPQNLEMVASKMGHTLRVKAWVTQALKDSYEQTLILRWKERYDAFEKSTVHLYPLKNLQTLANQTQDSNTKKFYQTAAYYSTHYLDNSAINIYDQTASEDTYRDNLLTELLRKSLNNETLQIQDGLNLANQYLTNSNFVTTRALQSEALFESHLGSRYVALAAPQGLRLGYINFVYPIAIDVKGPFGDPSEGIKQFPQAASVENRWWSDRWQDEFGGFPFLLLTPDGVAFHGPITEADDMWVLRRSDVSHSCMRMDPSDILELRELLPKDILSLQAKGQTIPAQVRQWPDVEDVNESGTPVVVDVAYYLTHGTGVGINTASNWQPLAIQKFFWTNTFSPYVGKLSSNNTFTVNTSTGANGAPSYQGVFTGLPIYQVVNRALTITGYYPSTQPLVIKTFPMRPTAIIQYHEDGVVYNQATHDSGDNEKQGQNSPTSFMHGD